MTTAKKIFFKIISPVTGIFSLPQLRGISGRNRLIPVYHAVSDKTPLHLKHLYRVKSTSEFEADLDVLCKYYKPISLHELIDLSEHGKKLSEPVFHLTFDDGLSEFYHFAAPILRKKGIPATCFLNNSFIDNKDMLFRLKVSILIDHLHHSEAGSASWENYHSWVKKHQYGNSYYRTLLMGLSYRNITEIEGLAADLKLSFKTYLDKHKPYLSTKQILELIDQGFTFGAHTFTHPDFRDMDETGQLNELKQSVEDLGKRFNLKYKVFSFPFTDFGVQTSFFDIMEKDRLSALSFGCAGIKEDVSAINIQRMPVEEYSGKLKNVLKREYLYHFFLRLAGKAKMKR